LDFEHRQSQRHVVEAQLLELGAISSLRSFSKPKFPNPRQTQYLKDNPKGFVDTSEFINFSNASRIFNEKFQVLLKKLPRIAQPRLPLVFYSSQSEL